MSVNERTRQFVRERAKHLCEYCHSPERSSSDIFTIDHLTPQSLGGSDELNNLALACRRCNERHYNFTTGIDPENQQEVPLFNVHANHFSPSSLPRTVPCHQGHSWNSGPSNDYESYRSTC